MIVISKVRVRDATTQECIEALTRDLEVIQEKLNESASTPGLSRELEQFLAHVSEAHDQMRDQLQSKSVWGRLAVAYHRSFGVLAEIRAIEEACHRLLDEVTCEGEKISQKRAIARLKRQGFFLFDTREHILRELPVYQQLMRYVGCGTAFAFMAYGERSLTFVRIARDATDITCTELKEMDALEELDTFIEANAPQALPISQLQELIELLRPIRLSTGDYQALSIQLVGESIERAPALFQRSFLLWGPHPEIRSALVLSSASAGKTKDVRHETVELLPLGGYRIVDGERPHLVATYSRPQFRKVLQSYGMPIGLALT